MKFFYINKFVYGNVAKMLNEIYNTKTEKLSNYCIIFEPAAIKFIDFLKAKGLKVIYYDLEHIKVQHFLDKTYEEIKNKADEIWTYSLANKEYLQKLKFNVKFQPIVYTECLNEIPISNSNFVPPIDLLFYGRISDYRLKNMVEPIQKIGLTYVQAHGITGEKLNWLMQNSKIIIDSKQREDYYNQNIIRIAYSVINNKCVLAESTEDDGYAGDSVIYYSDENSLIEKINFLLQNNNWLKIAKSCSNKFKELSNSGDKWHTSEIIL